MISSHSGLPGARSRAQNSLCRVILLQEQVEIVKSNYGAISACTKTAGPI
jgi:hypothetical protein